MASPTSSVQLPKWIEATPEAELRRGVVIIVLIAWLAVHLLFWNTFIYHDTWKHLFPFLVDVSRNMACEGTPHWLGTVDSGTPHIVSTISSSTTQIVRWPLLFLMSCADLSLEGALHIYRAGILVTYLLFALGMYVLGTLLFASRWSAVFVFCITLFSGFFLQTMHSDQATNLIFYYPWIVAALVLFYRHLNSPVAAVYLNLAALFVGLQALDQAPHVLAVSVFLGLALHIWTAPREFWSAVVSHWKWCWPALLIAGLAGYQLYLVQLHIYDYLPAFRADIVVHPSNFGETGLLQPSAFIGVLLPASFGQQFAYLADASGQMLTALGFPGQTGFIFVLDVLLFSIGALPFFLIVFFFCQPGYRRARVYLGFFIAVLVLVCLQQTRVYYLTFELPFFDVFRAYLLLFVVAVFPAFLAAGYGMDALTVLPRAYLAPSLHRMRRTLILFYGLGFLAVGVWVLGSDYKGPGGLTMLVAALVIDIVCIAFAVGAIWWIVAHWFSSQRAKHLLLIGTATALGCLATFGSYTIYGISKDQAVAAFTLEDRDMRELPIHIAANPNAVARQLCDNFEECYLSRRPSVSLNLDLDGTFLRSRGEAVFQEGLSIEAVKVLSAVTHPIFWVSEEVLPYADGQTVVSTMNLNSHRISDFLREQTFVPTAQVELVDEGKLSGSSFLTFVQREQDVFRVHYSSDSEFYLNAAISYDAGWQARVGEEYLPVVRGNFGGLLTRVPAGDGMVVFEYRNMQSTHFFVSRFVMSLVGAAGMLFIFLQGLQVGGMRSKSVANVETLYPSTRPSAG